MAQLQLFHQVNRDPEEARTSNPEDVHRLIWCPYLPDDDDDDEPSPSKLLVLTHSNVAEMWNVDMVVSEYGAGPLNPSQIKTGRLCINDHTAPIVDATFSPDGTALATASADGQVKFFQVYMHGLESPRCLHEWAPHNGKPLSSLFFLDNHRNHQADEQFWKYAVTGTSLLKERRRLRFIAIPFFVCSIGLAALAALPRNVKGLISSKKANSGLFEELVICPTLNNP